PPVGLLLEDLRLPLRVPPADARSPVQERVVELTDLFDPLHELGEALELRPFVVGGRDRDVDLDHVRDRARLGADARTAHDQPACAEPGQDEQDAPKRTATPGVSPPEHRPPPFSVSPDACSSSPGSKPTAMQDGRVARRAPDSSAYRR